MSWDASLHDDRGHCEGDWNYTHNTNGMIEAALIAEPGPGLDDRALFIHAVSGMDIHHWWDELHGADGPVGAAFLNRIVTGLEADPDRFRAMNPPNGWGDYDGLLNLLRRMRDAVPEWPCTWSVSG